MNNKQILANKRDSYTQYISAEKERISNHQDVVASFLERFAQRLNEVEINLEPKSGDRRRRRNEQRLKGLLMDHEIQDDIDIINGNTANVNKQQSNVVYSSGILRINSEEFEKGDEVRFNINGEESTGFITSINFTETCIKASDGSKVRLVHSAIKMGRVFLEKNEC